MSDSTSAANRSKGPAVAVVILGHLGLLLIPFAVAVVGPGGASVVRWYADGGFFMHLILLLLMAQMAGGATLGIVGLFARLPAVIYLVVPSMAFAVGLGGTAIGTMQGWEAIATAPPDMVLPLWTAVMGIAGTTRTFGLLVVTLGGMSLALGAGSAAFARRDEGAAAGGAGIGAAAAGVALLVAGLAAALAGLLGLWAAQPLAHVALTLILVAAIPAAGLGGWGAFQLARSLDADSRAFGVASALALGLGLVLATWSLGNLFATTTLAAALDAMASAPPELKTAMLSAAAVDFIAIGRATPVYIGAAIIVGALLAAAAAPGFSAWVDKRALWGGAAIILVAIGLALDLSVAAWIGGLNSRLLERQFVALPAGIKLPIAVDGEPFHGDGPVVLIKEHAVWLDGEPLAAGLSDSSLAALKRALGSDVPAEDRPLDDERMRRQGYGIAAALAAEPICDASAARRFGLGLDAEATGIADTLAWLRQAGACRVSLLTRGAQPSNPAATDAGRDLLDSMGPVGEIVAATARMPTHLPLSLAEQIPQYHWGDSPRLDLMLTVARGRVALSGVGGELPAIAAAADGRIDADALTQKLTEIKDTFPEARLIYLHARASATVQELVDATAIASGPAPDGEPLFAEPVWVTSDRRPEVPAQAPPRQIPGVYDGAQRVGMGALPKEAIQEVIKRNKTQVRYCYEKQLQRDPNLEGKISVQFVIGATGAVTRVSTTEVTLPSPEVVACVEKVVAAMRFPQPVGGGIVEVNYPFIFRAAQ